MTKNVLVTISGKRMMNDGDEDVELVIPGTYCRKAGLHTVCYEEPGEGDDPGTRNTILIGSDGMQILRGTPEARSRLCVCRASFLMTFVMSGMPHRLPAMDMNLSKLQVMVMAKKAWGDEVHGISKSLTQLSD